MQRLEGSKVSLIRSPSLPLYLYLPPSVPLYISLSIAVSLSYSRCLSLSLSSSLSLFTPSLYHCLSLFISILLLFISLVFSPRRSLPLSVFRSLPPSILSPCIQLSIYQDACLANQINSRHQRFIINNVTLITRECFNLTDCTNFM